MNEDQLLPISDQAVPYFRLRPPYLKFVAFKAAFFPQNNFLTKSG